MRTCNPARDDVIAMLAAAGLPVADIAAGREVHFIGIRDDGLIAVGGFECHGTAALVRSMVTAHTRRGTGVGSTLLGAIEEAAGQQGARDLYLLTETAESFFSSRGYALSSRARAPAAIASSPQFSSLCPSSAAFMHKRLA